MSLGIIGELQFFAFSLLRGILILLIYDLIRIFRRVVPHGAAAIALEDILYWLLTAFLIFQLLYRENDGTIRGYALLAVGLGMLVYYRTLSKFLVNALAWILNKILSFLLKPVRVVCRKIVQVSRVAARFYKKKLKNKLKEFIIILFS